MVSRPPGWEDARHATPPCRLGRLHTPPVFALMQRVRNVDGRSVEVLERGDIARWLVSKWTIRGTLALLVALVGFAWRLSAKETTRDLAVDELRAKVAILQETAISAKDLKQQVDSLRIDLRATVSEIRLQLPRRP